jgi:hypothetical protein
MDYLGYHPPQLASSPSLMSADVRSPVVGVVRSRSLFESIMVTPEHFLPSSASSSPFSASATFSTSDQSNGSQEHGFMSSAMSTSTTDLMEFCTPSKKHRPDAGHQNKTTLHQKRKWDSVDDEEEEEVGEEEELNDSSDDEDEAHPDLRQQHRPREERSSTVIVSFPASHEMDKSAKHQRVVQKKPDARDIPRARHIILRFCDSQQSVEAKIVCKEPWGVRVEVLEERPDLSLSIGTRYWARFTGTVSLITNIPVLEAMHPC